MNGLWQLLHLLFAFRYVGPMLGLMGFRWRP